ncbi:hypothetical protein [Albibacillus kandeliae]|uniref:hypothetical protein n=1 Tax=Albibacillus kandeliae TaxID=2174228 RepID=UPI001300870A|nr:hypothetical protein [Albibacillus kandeliae]
MDNNDVQALTFKIKGMVEDTAEFSEEFAKLSEEQLEELADKQAKIAAEAEYKQHAAETEIRLRSLRAAITNPT